MFKYMVWCKEKNALDANWFPEHQIDATEDHFAVSDFEAYLRSEGDNVKDLYFYQLRKITLEQVEESVIMTEGPVAKRAYERDYDG